VVPRFVRRGFEKGADAVDSPYYPEGSVVVMDEKKLQALARKNAAKAAAQQKPKAKYDDTITPANDPDQDALKLFKEMKKREF
jgi:hypothetical protein